MVDQLHCRNSFLVVTGEFREPCCVQRVRAIRITCVCRVARAGARAMLVPCQ